MKRKRNRLDTDERRQKLLEVGIALFGTHPYDELSIDRIAKLAKVSKGLLYHYFPTKKDFCIAVIRAVSGSFITETGLGDDVPPPVRLRKTLEVFFAFAENNAEAFYALYRGAVGVDPEARSILETNRQVLAGRLAQGIGMEKPSLVMSNILYSAICYIEASTLYWLDHRSGKKTDIITALGASVEALLLGASGTAL